MIPVLDHGYVKVIRVDGSDEEIAQTARTSTDTTATPEQNARLVRRLVRDRHTSPIEFVGLVLEIQMPIFIARQWMRHRTGSFNEFSMRYSEAVDLYYVPNVERCQEQSTFNKQGSAEQLPEEIAEEIRQRITETSDGCFDQYQMLRKLGLTRELARSVLPVNYYTKVRWRIDLHNLMHFMKLREDSHAQWEIQQYANVIHELCSEHFPIATEAFENHVQNPTTISDEAAAYLGGVLTRLDDELDETLSEYPSLLSELRELARRNNSG